MFVEQRERERENSSHYSVTATTGTMNGVLGHDSAVQGYTGSGTTRANEMNVGMNHVPGVGSIVRSVDQH